MAKAKTKKVTAKNAEQAFDIMVPVQVRVYVSEKKMSWYLDEDTVNEAVKKKIKALGGLA